MICYGPIFNNQILSGRVVIIIPRLGLLWGSDFCVAGDQDF